MLRVAVQVKELISSNVTSAIETASDPAKMLNRLQREIEESIITLEGERTLCERRQARLENERKQTELREADWDEKAKIAMDHGREDLARQALVAREECKIAIEKANGELETCSADLVEINQAISDLETKREETRAKAQDQARADAENAPSGTSGAARSASDAHRSRIAELEKRTAFVTQESAQQRTHASVDKEINAMRQASKIDAELAEMKSAATKAPAKKAPAKKRAAK